MKDKKSFLAICAYIGGAIGTGVLLLFCCMLPLGFILLGALGIGWFTPYFNYVLIVVIGICILLAYKTYIRSKNEATCCPPRQKLFICPECKLEYREQKWRDECEKFCKEHNACNIEITSHAVNKEK